MKFVLSNREDIQPSLVMVDEFLKKHCKNPKSANIYQMLTEDILFELFSSSPEKIVLVTKKTHKNKVIRISVKGEEKNILSKNDGGKSDRTQGDETLQLKKQISSKLISAYNYCIQYRYLNDENIYEIVVDKKKSAFENEILNFYETNAKKIEKRPLSLIFWFSRKKFLSALLAIFIKMVKHQCVLLLPIYFSIIIDAVVSGKEFFSKTVMLGFLGAAISILFNLVCNKLDQKVFKVLVNGFETDLKKACIKKLNNLSLLIHNGTQTGKITSKLLVDTQNIRNMIATFTSNFVDCGLNILTIILITLFKCPSMLIFYAILFPIASFSVYHFKHKMSTTNRNFRKKREKSNASISEMLEMEFLTRSYGLQKKQYSKISEELSDTNRSQNIFQEVSQSFSVVQFGLLQLFHFISFGFAIYMASKGYITIGLVIVFNSNFTTIVNDMVKLLENMENITVGYESLISLNEILCIESEEERNLAKMPSNISGKIEYKDLVFAYPDSEKNIFDGLNLEIPAGKSVAFIGESGCGKSTLLNLTIGLLKPKSGKILVDGYDLNEVQMESFRRNIAVVPQNSLMFSGTLWDNLVFGLDYVTTAQVVDVIKKVGLEDLVDSLPEGLNSKINERGSNLSGGQKQRISIARALLRNPKLILLDEATSALDNESEKLVQKSIDAMMKQCTVLMVAHRLTTIKNADLIYRIKNGRAEKVESYESLVKN